MIGGKIAGGGWERECVKRDDQEEGVDWKRGRWREWTRGVRREGGERRVARGRKRRDKRRGGKGNQRKQAERGK